MEGWRLLFRRGVGEERLGVFGEVLAAVWRIKTFGEDYEVGAGY